MEVSLIFNPFNPLKILHYSDRIHRLMDGEIVPPVMVSFDFANPCNQKCVWCAWTKHRRVEGGFMSREVLEDVIDTMGSEVEGWEVCGGGEPLLNRNSHEYLEKLHDTGKRILLVTNGTFLTEDDARNCSTIRVSLDAGFQSTHADLHGSEDWNKIIDNIEKASKITKVGLGFLIHPANYREIYDFTLLSRGLGARFAHIRPCYTDYEEVRDIVGFDWFTWSEAHETEIMSEVNRAKSLETDKFDVWTTFYKVMPKKWPFSKCYALTLDPCISPTGGVWICCERRGIEKSLIGTIGVDGSFREIWYSKKHEELIRDLPDQLCPFKCKYSGYNRAIHEAYVNKSLDLDWI